MNNSTLYHLPIIIVLLTLFALTAFSSATEVVASPSMVTLQQGSSSPITLYLDETPDGLVGYRLNITLSNPASAQITDVRYPEWAVLKATQGVPGTEVQISGADLGKAIESGASSVPLAILTIQGLDDGACTLVISESRFDADDGTLMVVDPVQVTITVTGTTLAGTSSGAGSGSVSSSSTGRTDSLENVTRDTTEITATVSATSPAIKGTASSVTPEHSKKVPVVEGTPLGEETSSAPLQGSEQDTAIPVTALLAGAGLFILMGIFGYLVIKKRR